MALVFAFTALASTPKSCAIINRPSFALSSSMRSTDGAMRFINIAFSDGRASFTAETKDSKRWEVARELINSGLPPEAHMDFAGIVITAVE